MKNGGLFHYFTTPFLFHYPLYSFMWDSWINDDEKGDRKFVGELKKIPVLDLIYMLN